MNCMLGACAHQRRPSSLTLFNTGRSKKTRLTVIASKVQLLLLWLMNLFAVNLLNLLVACIALHTTRSKIYTKPQRFCLSKSCTIQYSMLVVFKLCMLA